MVNVGSAGSLGEGRLGVSSSVRLAYDTVALGSVVAEIPSVELPTTHMEAELAPLYRRLGLKAGWIEAVTGISSRRAWASDEAYVDGAVRAARRALEHAQVAPHEVGALLSCAVYRHRLEPTIASSIQAGLGLGAGCMNFDVSNACLGFMTGLQVAANMVALGQIDHALVVASEDAGPVTGTTVAALQQPSASIHDFKDNLATLTLGSAAAAAVVTRADRTGGARRLLGGAVCSATQHNHLCEGDAQSMRTDSVALLREGVALARHTWTETQAQLGWSADAPAAYCLHQVGKAHTDTLVGQLGLRSGPAPRLYPWLGNVGSVAVPITLALASEQGQVRAGDPVALMGIGSGLNCMMLGVRW